MKEILKELIALGPLLLYAGAVVAAVAWHRWRRETKWPFKENDRLLRMPGESLKRQVQKLEDDFVGEFLGGTIACLAAVPASYHAFTWIGLSSRSALFAAIIVFIIVLGASAWRIGRLSLRRSNYYMGWFGERLVADRLRPLQAEGYRIFHDVPCEGATGKFNIDHLTVGPTGIAVIETKTRRKPKALATDATMKEHEVTFDGAKLQWSDGRSSERAIGQVHSSAKWLIDWIAERTGVKVSATRIVTIPGWMVHERPKSPNPGVRVIPPHFLPAAVKGRGQVMLTAEQVDLISRLLEVECRDVEE